MEVFPKTRILIVGLSSFVGQDVQVFLRFMEGLMMANIAWVDGALSVPSLERALEVLNGCLELELVHVYRGESHFALAQHCDTLAYQLSLHPKKPVLNLGGSQFNFLHTALKHYPNVRFGPFESVVLERWLPPT